MTMNDPRNRPDPATGEKYLTEQEMIALFDQAIKDQEIKYPSPLPLWSVPRWMKIFGYPNWRFKTPSGDWHYLPNSEYARLFSNPSRLGVRS
jgi:hypothetical protein